MSVSVIIPTLNEAAHIGQLVHRLFASENSSLQEVIVVDGGSNDDTSAIARNAGALVIEAPLPSRARQMNLGAAKATGDILFFVHGDTLPPTTFIADILQAVQLGFPQGCFRARYDSANPLLRINSYFTGFDQLWCRGGDQGLFITQPLFDQLGGFDDELIIMEEYDWLQRSRPQFPFVILPAEIHVSARKYEKNAYIKVQLTNLLVFNMYRLGFSQERMLRTYRYLLRY